jgi:aminoglycoside phosphotransferase (APT) family kinase protein
VLVQAGAALAAIHSVPVGGFYKRHDDGSWDFPDWDGLMRAAVRDRTAEMPLLLSAGFTEPDLAALRATLETHRDDYPCSQPVLCHGDFSPEHWIVDAGPNLSGVIDFGEFQGGPPITDIAYLSMERPDIDLSGLRRGYGDSDWWDDGLPRRLLLHRAGLQMGYLAHYLRQGNREEAEPMARGLRATLGAWRAMGDR